MNKIFLIGRLTKDPELSFTPGAGTAVCKFILAVDRQFKNADGKKDADFLPIVVWKKPAEIINQYMKKGSLIGIGGRIQTRNYQNKSGDKVYVTEVICEDFQFLGGKNESSNNNNNSSNDNSGYQTNDDVTPLDDGETPF
jgi:single-strand DNA-binding protein